MKGEKTKFNIVQSLKKGYLSESGWAIYTTRFTLEI